jgi:hypothetical protein
MFYFKNPRADFSMTNIAVNALGVAAMSLDIAEARGSIPKHGLGKHITKDVFSTVGQAITQLSDSGRSSDSTPTAWTPKGKSSMKGISELLTSKEDSNHESPLVPNCMQCCIREMRSGVSKDGEACAANTMFGEACQCLALTESCFGLDQENTPSSVSADDALSLPRTEPAQVTCADAFTELTQAVVGVDSLIVPEHRMLRDLLYKPITDGGCGVVSPHEFQDLL